MSVALLHRVLGERVARWRASGYPADAYPALAEVLEYPDAPFVFRVAPGDA